MKDPERQHEETSAFPISDFTRRLLRRATEPLGVINVRHAVELHARSSLLPGQRLEFLNNLKSRYGTGQGAGTASPFTAPLQRMAASGPFNLGSAPPWGSRTATPETAQGTHSKTRAESVQYRVKRPNAHMRPNLSHPLSSEIVASQSAAVAEIRPGSISIPEAQPQGNTSTTQSPDGMLAGPAAAEISGDAVPLPDGSLPQVSELPSAVLATPMHLQRMPERLEAAEPESTRENSPGNNASTSSGSLPAGPLPQISELSPAIVAAPMHLQRMPERSAAAEPKSTRENSPGNDAPTSSGSLPAGPLPQISELSPAIVAAPMHLQRKSDHSFTFPATGSVQTAETGAALPPTKVNPQSHAEVSPEIRVLPSSPGSTSMVWRKAETNGASRESATPGGALLVGPTYANEPQVMRQAASESVSSGAVAPVAAPTSESGGADVTRIAEQVSRIIARQLRIERERRGRTR